MWNRLHFTVILGDRPPLEAIDTTLCCRSEFSNGTRQLLTVSDGNQKYQKEKTGFDHSNFRSKSKSRGEKELGVVFMSVLFAAVLMFP